MLCKAAAQWPSTLLGQGSRPAGAFLLLLQWTMQPVKGILESMVYVGKTFLIRPPDAKPAAGRAADEPYPRPWALRCLAGTSHSFPVQDSPQCCRHSSSTTRAGHQQRWRGGEARRSPGCPANLSSSAGWLHHVTMAQNELTAASSVAVHVSGRRRAQLTPPWRQPRPQSCSVGSRGQVSVMCYQPPRASSLREPPAPSADAQQGYAAAAAGLGYGQCASQDWDQSHFVTTGGSLPPSLPRFPLL